VSKTTNTADVYIVGEVTIVSEAVPRGSVVKRGLLIGEKSVQASSGRLTDDVSPRAGRSTPAWPPAYRRTSPARPALPRPRYIRTRLLLVPST
jgi:hypothetical protein